MLHQAKNLLRNAYEWFGKNCYGIDVCFWLGPGNGQFPVPAEHQLWCSAFAIMCFKIRSEVGS